MRALDVTLSASEIASHLGGTLWGSSSYQVHGICSLEYPRPDSITFARVKSRKVLTRLMESLCNTALLIPASLVDGELTASAPRIAVADPFRAMMSLIPLFFAQEEFESGIHPTAIIHPTAKIDPGAAIGAMCTVGEGCSIEHGAILHPQVTLYSGVTVGQGSVLHSGVVIRERCTIGKGCAIHNNTTIGADGFGYIPHPTEGLQKVPQVGNVEIGDRVEIGANTSIDRGAFGATIIGSGTKIDNQVQIGHNVVIGSHCIVCGQVGIAGSTIIGDRVVIGGAVGISDHLSIASDVRIGAAAVVLTSLTKPGDYAGSPVMPARAWRRTMIAQLKSSRGHEAGD